MVVKVLNTPVTLAPRPAMSCQKKLSEEDDVWRVRRTWGVLTTTATLGKAARYRRHESPMMGFLGDFHAFN